MASDDWRVGDLALCVRSGEKTISGAVYTVSAVYQPGWGPHHGVPGRFGVLSLDFEGLPITPGRTSAASRFRKIRPHAPDAEDEETIRLYQGKPARQDA